MPLCSASKHVKKQAGYKLAIAAGVSDTYDASMLSYRHAFHAGNHADILKHLVLNSCLTHLCLKEKPFLYLDTHAGAGAYKLDAGYAAANEEWETGIQSLVNYTETSSPPEDIRLYLEQIKAFRAYEGSLVYPGSPALAEMKLRQKDRAVLFELHPTDFSLLNERFLPNPRFSVFKEDGYSNLAAFLPPQSRRGLLLMDPSYEISDEYDRVVKTHIHPSPDYQWTGPNRLS